MFPLHTAEQAKQEKAYSHNFVLSPESELAITEWRWQSLPLHARKSAGKVLTEHAVLMVASRWLLGLVSS